MIRQTRSELLGMAFLAAMVAGAVSQIAIALTEPYSTPVVFSLDERERRDGPTSLSGRRPSPRPLLRMAFAGDIMQHRWQAADDFRASYHGIEPLLAPSDLAVGNLEFPVDETRPVGPGAASVRFNGSSDHIAALAGAGFDALSIANNHCYDQGADGLARTEGVLARFDLAAIGSATGLAREHLLVLERRGVRVGFFAYTYPPNSHTSSTGDIEYWQADWPVQVLNFADWSAEYRTDGLDRIRRHVRAAKEAQVDWLVAIVHWGREWQFQPTPDQRLAGRDFIDVGFDMVVGSHSHVLNPVEVYRDRLIAYSLGNAISDFRQWQARVGAVLQVDLDRSSDGRLQISDFRAIPILTERSGHRVRPVLSDGAGDRRYRDLASAVLGPACAFTLSPLSSR